MSRPIIEKLKALSVMPSREGGGFENWLKQEDSVSFLEQNARQDELVIYASGDHAFIRTVVIPNKFLEPPDMLALREWELMHDKWGINYRLDKPEIWVEPPFDHEKGAYEHAEVLLHHRHFEGYDTNKNYFELSQKLAHIFDLHYVEHLNAWCRLDENGDLEGVVRILRIGPQDSFISNFAVLIKRSVLDEYLLAAKATAIRAFDFTRFDKSAFSGWGDGRNQVERTDEEFAYRLTTQPGVGSYLRGIQLVRPLESLESLHDRLAHAREQREYASFIVQDWKNNVITEVSCAPGATSNYFTKSDLPFELSPAFFRPEVLSRYKADPKKYKIEERSIYCRGAWHLQTYDINEEGQVHTYLVYLRSLPYSEQLYWKGFNEAPKAPIAKRAFKTDFEGAWHTDYNPLQSLLGITGRLAEKNVPWWKLRDEELRSSVHYPATASAEEWANELMALDKLLVEGFEPSWLRKKAEETGQTPEAKDASLMLLYRCLCGLGFEEADARSVVAPLRSLHHHRTKLKGHVGGSDAEQLKKDALRQFGSFRNHFEQLCAECDESLQRILKAFDKS